MKTRKPLIAALLAVAIGAPIAGFVGYLNGEQPMTPLAIEVPFLHGRSDGQVAGQSGLASLERANEWLNSPPLSASALRGKVVLVEFWTYTCINWLRTQPYVRAWDKKYRDQGLVVIGVHAPEFSFEKDLTNVRWAVKNLRVDYPVAVDSEHVIWRAFSNQYWPALYFIDAEGRIRHHQFGEGGYEESEMVIRELLAETAVTLDIERASVDASGIEKAADWGNLKSPENYLGYQRTENFASPDAVLDGPHLMKSPSGCA